MLIRNLGLTVNLESLDFLKGEHLQEAFLKINPLHQVPVLVDGDFTVTESKAILAYLVNSRKPGSSLYPSDPKLRAVVDQRMYYDATVVFPTILGVVVSQLVFSIDKNMFSFIYVCVFVFLFHSIASNNLRWC